MKKSKSLQKTKVTQNLRQMKYSEIKSLDFSVGFICSNP